MSAPIITLVREGDQEVFTGRREGHWIDIQSASGETDSVKWVGADKYVSATKGHGYQEPPLVAQIVKHAPGLGVCVALAHSSAPTVIEGHLWSGQGFPPDPDLTVIASPGGAAIRIETHTPDGKAFLDLLKTL